MRFNTRDARRAATADEAALLPAVAVLVHGRAALAHTLLGRLLLFGRGLFHGLQQHADSRFAALTRTPYEVCTRNEAGTHGQPLQTPEARSSQC